MQTYTPTEHDVVQPYGGPAVQKAMERWAEKARRQAETQALSDLSELNKFVFSDGTTFRRDPEADGMWSTSDDPSDRDLLTDEQMLEVMQS